MRPVIAVSPLLLANAGLQVGTIGSLSTLATSGIEILDAERITLIYDTKGKPGKDSFFEAFVKETISEPSSSVMPAAVDSGQADSFHLAVDLKFLAIHHFVELTYNGILRRLLVSFARPTPSPELPDPSDKYTPKSNHIFAINRSTTIVFKSPVAPLPKKRLPPSSANALESPINGELRGYEAIGGMEAQIEQIRELVEWPLTRPELYNHFGESPFPLNLATGLMY